MTQPPADTQRQPPSHVLLLNKFNVLPHHALVVTSAFEHQTEALTVEDLDATWRALDAYPPPGETPPCILHRCRIIAPG